MTGNANSSLGKAESHLLSSGLYRRCRSFNGSALHARQAFGARGLYRRSGFSPHPEDYGRKDKARSGLIAILLDRFLDL